jgi:osmotically-inducible protein OsmY
MKTFQKFWASIFVIVQIGVFNACKTHPHKHIVAELLDDKVTTERVELALKRSGADEFNHVKVNTSEGVVTLSGFVSNSDAKQRAEKVAEETHRATHVQNELQVK